MDKIKEKLEKLRIEADNNIVRAEKAEAEVRTVKEALSQKENETLGLKNKITLLENEVARAEKRAEDHKVKKNESDTDSSNAEVLQRKIGMLEKQVDDKETERKQAVEKARGLEMTAENFERKAKQTEGEKNALEKQLADMTEKYSKAKAELDQTLKDLEGL